MTYKEKKLKEFNNHLVEALLLHDDKELAADLKKVEPYRCPVCNGQGIVSRPPYIAGDIYTWTSSQASWVCKACEGKGIVWG